jgi:hypothetical protein
MFGDDEVYLGKTHPEISKILDELTLPRNWDFDRFKRVFLALGIIGNGQALPAPNRPDSVHFQGFRRYVDGLIQRTRQNGEEHAQPVFVDLDYRGFVMGKVTHGKENEVRLDIDKQPGRERFQRLIGSVHTHPSGVSPDTAHGLSGQDYRTLLSDPSQQLMMITWGNEYRMLILKTSVTPNNLKPAQVDAKVKACEDEFLRDSTKLQIIRVVEFNKTICAEFGLTMYLADINSRDLFNRVNVV